MDKHDITVLLLELGIQKGDQIMVHSSLKSLGYVDGGADAVIDAILETIGQEGTLLVPTNTFQGSVTIHLRNTNEVDLRYAPSTTGLISETIRLRKECIRSMHPTHPVGAIGSKAWELVREHHLGDSPAGEKSPYGKLAAMKNGKVLLIGVTNGNNTMIHTAEEYYTPYIFNGETFRTRVISADGRVLFVNTKGYCVGIRRNFTALDPFLKKAKFMTQIAVAESRMSLINAPGLLETAREKILEDPYFLIDKDKQDA